MELGNRPVFSTVSSSRATELCFQPCHPPQMGVSGQHRKSRAESTVRDVLVPPVSQGMRWCHWYPDLPPTDSAFLRGVGRKALKPLKWLPTPKCTGGADASIRSPVWHRTAERLQVLLKERPGIHQNRGAVTSGLAPKGSLRHQCQDNHLHAS